MQATPTYRLMMPAEGLAPGAMGLWATPRARARRPGPSEARSFPTLIFSGIGLTILGTATLFATCIASFGG